MKTDIFSTPKSSSTPLDPNNKNKSQKKQQKYLKKWFKLLKNKRKPKKRISSKKSLDPLKETSEKKIK